MKKIVFLFFLITYTFTYTKNINFIFNVPTGKIYYQNIDTTNNGSIDFYEKNTIITLKDGRYNLSFTTENYSPVEIEIDTDSITAPVYINFSNNTSVFISGTLTSKGKNIGYQEVEFINANNHHFTLKSDILGKFSGYLPKGKYKIKIEKNGYKNNPELHNLNADTYNLKIELEEVESFIRGVVVDSNGNNIPYPNITIRNNGKIYNITGDEFGIFTQNVNAGIISILVDKDGYNQNGIVRAIDKNSSITNITIPLVKNKFTISGTLTDSIAPLKNIKIDLRDEDYKKIATTTTNENGFFEFYKLDSYKNVFLTISKGKKLLYASPLITLEENIKNFNIFLEDME